MTLKARVIPCLDVRDGRTRIARGSFAARTCKRKSGTARRNVQ